MERVRGEWRPGEWEEGEEREEGGEGKKEMRGSRRGEGRGKKEWQQIENFTLEIC